MELSREQLYEMLWSNGVGKTEGALGLKQAELKKLCETHQIPRPSSAYWSAFHLGKSPGKTPLPPSSDNRPIHIEDYIKPRRVKKEKSAPKLEPQKKSAEGKYEPRELPEEAPTNIYTVPKTLYIKDPILMDTKQKLREKNSLSRRDNPWSKKNPYKSSPRKWLSIDVSEEQEDRALRIFATVWKAAEARGYHLRIDVDKGTYYTTCTTFFIVRDYRIRVELKEIQQQARKEDGSRDPSRLIGSGRLKFICCERDRHYSYSNDRIAAQDTTNTRLEDKIERIVEVFGEIADERDRAKERRKLEEEERKRKEELKRQEEERKRLEAEEQARIETLRDEERGRVTELLFEAERIKTAALIREYASKYESAMAGHLPPDELKVKLQWMYDKADFIDPFVQREDELLLPKDISRLLNPEIVKTTEERHTTSYGYGNSNETTYSYWQIKNMWRRR